MLSFNVLLRQCGIDPNDVLLIRHQEHRNGGRSPYDLWCDERSLFNSYQSRQGIQNRARFSKAKFWAAFVVTPQAETLFAGLYTSRYGHPLEADCPHPLGGEPEQAGKVDCYVQEIDERFAGFVGRLIIDWGVGFRQWAQWANNQDKPILELRREFKEPEFPGFRRFISPLSKILTSPQAWITTLKNSKGIYLLTCPKTKEWYVGSAYGADGFWGRWMCYVTNSHGGNIELKNRDPSDFQVSILEVARSDASDQEIIEAEGLWKDKLQSRAMGLNKN